jgi:transmembrane sensor
MMRSMDEIDPVAREEAAAWHARLQSRGVSNGELDEFYSWREAPENARAFDVVEKLWARSADLRDDPDIARLLRDFSPSPWSPRGIVEAMRTRLRRPFPAAVFASVLGLLILAVALRPDHQTYRTEVGQRLSVTLEDGSRVTLDTASSMSVRFSKSERRIVLDKGQVMFEVAHDPRRPFRVSANDARVTAIGTIFQVARDASRTRIVLIKGRISISPSAGRAPTYLGNPGDTLDVGGRRLAISRSDPAISTSWVDGKIDLRDVPLEAAIAEVNRYTERRVILDARSDAQTKVSGVFATGDPDAFAAAVEALLPLQRSQDQDGKIHLVERR